nr:uncharacterized mitochondrial protein AtMg00810-like [Tanacetum cinerariifolium]
IEPPNVAKALKDVDWVIAMQDELDQFARLKFWRLVPKPNGKTVIKPNGCSRIRMMKVVARIKGIHLFLAYAAHKNFTVFQMDIKTVFLNGILKKEVPDIMFATCMCARYQANPNEHHVSAIKKIFRYLKGTINLGLWYPKDFGFDLTAYSDADHRFDESFSEAWDRFKDLVQACPHHGIPKLHQLDTFYNALNSKDQDSLNSAAGGNFLDKMPLECLAIIESKSKVCYSRNKAVVAKVSTNTSTSGISHDVAELKDMVNALLLDKKSQNQALATVKAVEESCVTCGGAHSYR